MIKEVNAVDVEYKYRLGDIAKHGNRACDAMVNHPDSIGAKYLNHMLETKTAFDWDKLRELAQGHSAEKTDGMAAHFRMGDRHIHIIHDYVQNILDTGIKDVTIVCALHRHIKEINGDGTAELNAVISRLRDNGVNVDIRSSENPDDDFSFLVNSAHMHTSIGAFSMVAALCATGNVTHGAKTTKQACDMYKSFGKIAIEQPSDAGRYVLDYMKKCKRRI